MKVYTFLTETHKVFLSQFIDSFPFEHGLDLEIKYLPQECENGCYHTDGWKNTMKKKVEYILYSLRNTEDDGFFIHSDIDVQFFGDIRKDLSNLMIETKKDILFQSDGPQVCMGFFICRKNENTMNLFENILNNIDKFTDDQIAANFYIKTLNINYDVLPERYYTIGVKNGLWSGNNKNFIVPEDILIHHANFTIGIENKLKLLKMIRDYVYK